MGTQSTGEVAVEIGTNEPWLSYLVRHRKCSKPPKVRGKFAWTPALKREAREALEKNPEPKRS